MSKYRVDIQNELNMIAVTPYGKNMRPNIHDGLEKLARKQNALSDTFDSLIIEAGNGSNPEVVDARNDGVTPQQFNTLGERLDSMQEDIQILDGKFDGYLSLNGGVVTGNVVMKENMMFDNNKGISMKDTNGNDKWLLYIDTNDISVVGDNSLDTAIKGSLIYFDGPTSFKSTAQFQNNAPIRGQATDGRFADLVYMSPQNQVRVGSYNELFPTVINSSEDLKFENTTTRQTYTMWHEGNLPVESGNWTPILQTTGGVIVPDQIIQNGKYHKIGNRVYVTGNLQSTNTTGMVGQIVISGLPFLSSAHSYSTVTFGWVSGINTNGLRFSGYTQIGTNYIVLSYNDMVTGSFHTINQSNLTASCDIQFSAVFLID